MILPASFVHILSVVSAADLGRYILLALGLGFIVFFHELGHFLAAKYSKVKVEQFAVGFGTAIVAWRKGIGFRRGTTTPEMEERVEEWWKNHRVDGKSPQETQDEILTPMQVDRAREALHLGETEYRLNWIPLGGYVKMLGQDDMNPAATSDDPHSYNNKPIRLRMLIISAGVLMNIFLAAVGFMIVFLIGFSAPPPEVGGELAGSPASFAVTADGTRQPLQIGDRIVKFNGRSEQDFAKVALSVALVRHGESIPIVVEHRDGAKQTLYVTPSFPGGDTSGLLSMGVLPSMELRGPDLSDKLDPDLFDPNLLPAEAMTLKPGDVITAINGQPVPTGKDADNYWMLNQAMADSDGRPIDLTIRGSDGATRDANIMPHFQVGFDADDLNFAGMSPRARTDGVQSKASPAYGIVHPGDVIVAIKSMASGQTLENPSPQELRDAINAAGQADKAIVLTLLDPSGTTRQTSEIVPTAKVSADRMGLGIQLGADEQNTVVAGVAPNSAAANAGVQPGWHITKIAGQDVSNWFQVRRILSQASPGQPVPMEAQSPGGPVKVQLSMTQDQIDAMKYLTFTSDLDLRERTELRKTTNPLVAAAWGVSETRDFVLQFYVTLRRMIGGSVSYKQAMGPVGIVRFGAMSAQRGLDWLVWFLAMISANLAVANFLPIPVMDGGLFVLLILEAVQGRPLSANTQRIIQMVGLVIILSLFLLVTYQDITRPFGHG
jgi:regulator of sigma E protease